MNTFKLINLDVWGNKYDGFEVNNAHYTGITIELPTNFTDKQLKSALYKSGYFGRGITQAKINSEGEEDYSVYVNLTANRYGGCKPLIELRNTKLEG